MENLLNKDEKKLYELILYFRKQIEEVKNHQGGLHPDDEQIIKILGQSQTMLHQIELRRKEEIARKQKPTLTQCPQCQVSKERKPFSEKKSKAGYKCNQYRCEECKINYLDGTPNNAKDQLKFSKELLELTQKHEKELLANPETAKLIEEIKKQCELFRKACQTEEEALTALNESKKAQNKSIAAFKDYLLVAKIKGMAYGSSMGES